MKKKNKFTIGLLGLGENASKTLLTLNKDPSIKIIFCIPRIDINNKSWFDGGILSRSAKNLDIKVIKIKNVNNPTLIKFIRKSKIDLIVNMGHAQLFKKNFIKSTNFGILNYHPGLLPYARGSGAVVGELINGQTLIGRTCHLVDERFDLGSIVNQEKFKISKKIKMTEAFNILEKNIDQFILKSVKKILTKSKNHFFNKVKGFGRYYPKFEPGDEYIDWNDTTEEIFNKVRSRLYERFAITYLKNGLKKVLIADVEIPKKLNRYISVNGQVIDKSKKGILVKTKDTAIWIKSIFNEKENLFIKPTFKIGTCFQTINIADFIRYIVNPRNNF
jgi:methionyl-tRNA formyltransferase